MSSADSSNRSTDSGATDSTGDVRSRAFFGVTALLVLIAIVSDLVFAFTADDGLFSAPWQNALNLFSYFTICSNLVAGATCAVLAVRRPKSQWFWALRLSAVPAMITTGVVYHALLGGDFEGWRLVTDQILHTVIPVLVPVGWLVFGPRGRVSTRVVLLSLVWPIAWLVLTEVRGALFDVFPYEFMDPGVTGGPEVVATITVIFVAFVVMAFAAQGIDRVLRTART